MPEPARRALPTDVVPPPSLRAGLAMLWDAAPVASVALALTAGVLGLVPAAAALASGAVVRAVPGAVDAGEGLTGPEGDRLVVAVVVLAAIFLVSQVAQVVVSALREGYRMRVYFEVEHRTMAAALAPPLLDHLEGPEGRQLVELATHRTWPNMGAFAGDVMNVVGERVAAASSAVLVARFDVRVAVGLVVLWWAVGSRRRRRLGPAVTAGAARTRRPQYYRQLALDRRTAAELRVFGLAPWLLDRFDRGWHEAMSEVWDKRRATRVQLALISITVVAANASAFAMLAASARRGDLDAGDVTVVGVAMLSLSQLALASKNDRGVAEGTAIVPAVLELERMARAELVRTSPPVGGAAPPAGLPAREIRFEAVSFSYPGRDRPVFDGLDLVVPAGRSLAVVGANGAGKTTLVKLLARLHDPDAGRVTVDGTPLTSFSPAGWQQRVAAIFQDFNRYELSAADNVAFGALGIEDAGRIRRAAERAGALELLDDLPSGWATVLSRRFEGGTELSGGQWQRVALARALLAVDAGAGVLVLDEPTANLDVRGEVELFDRFLEVTRGCTTILISHRFSTVRRADRIVVLDAGCVVEDGTHDELRKAGGPYATMFELQAGRYAEEGAG